MKKINKTEPPGYFVNFVRRNNPNSWSDCLEIISDLRKHILIEEQNEQCAYCESGITFKSSKSHIDHYKRKAGHLFPELVCSYENLLVSCNNPYRCARHKDSEIKRKEDYSNLLNPVMDNPNTHFDYSFTGEILSKDEKGKYTIEIFNLNHKSLVERRKTLALQINAYKNQINFEEVKIIFKEYESFIERIWRS